VNWRPTTSTTSGSLVGPLDPGQRPVGAETDHHDKNRRDQGPDQLEGVVAVIGNPLGVIALPPPKAQDGIHQAALDDQENDRGDPHQHPEEAIHLRGAGGRQRRQQIHLIGGQQAHRDQHQHQDGYGKGGAFRHRAFSSAFEPLRAATPAGRARRAAITRPTQWSSLQFTKRPTIECTLVEVRARPGSTIVEFTTITLI
jgi:hypothetical protein